MLKLRFNIRNFLTANINMEYTDNEGVVVKLSYLSFQMSESESESESE